VQKDLSTSSGRSLGSACELIVALDFDHLAQAEACVHALDGLPVIFKVGLELFLQVGPAWVQEQVRLHQRRIFLDLKFHDIPATVSRAVVQAAHLGVELLTVHLSSGRRAFEAIAQVREAAKSAGSPFPRVLGVSVLTSFAEREWQEFLAALHRSEGDLGLQAGVGPRWTEGRGTGPFPTFPHPAVHSRDDSPQGEEVASGEQSPFQTSVAASVDGLVRAGVGWGGVDGVVCSAWELQRLQAALPGLFTVVPGIRPQGVDRGDQARVATPVQAALWGASAIVVGRPITRAADPRAVAVYILKELCSV
jgi:orotidine-5'-phosphate decarboxylase